MNAKKNVLLYSPDPVARATVRRKYKIWREQNGIPMRCDMPECRFHSEPLVWMSKPLPLILDHVNGNNKDNTPKNLRYVCPNCDSQLSTRGGANRGRVENLGHGSYVLKAKDGSRHFHFFPEGGYLQLSGHAPVVFVSGKASSEAT